MSQERMRDVRIKLVDLLDRVLERGYGGEHCEPENVFSGIRRIGGEVKTFK